MSNESPSSNQIISVRLNQLEWPDILGEQIAVELLSWIVTEDFSVSVLATAAKRRIHVVPKPKTRKSKTYIVVGGVISYLMLLKTGWDGNITCVLDSDHSCSDTQSFQDDLYLGLCAIKAGPVSNAAKAVLLQNILDMGEAAKCTSGISLSSRHLNGSTDVLKLLTGYDSRAFKRSGKEDIPEEVLSSIMMGLGIDQSNSNAKTSESNDRHLQ